MKCPDPPVGARTAPGRGWTLAPCPQLRASTPFYLPLPPLHLQAARRRLHREEAQSGACAPPQGRPTRPPPISRGPSRPLPTTHTLIRVGGPTGPRRWPSLHTAETTALGRGSARSAPLRGQERAARRAPWPEARSGLIGRWVKPSPLVGRSVGTRGARLGSSRGYVRG